MESVAKSGSLGASVVRSGESIKFVSPPLSGGSGGGCQGVD